MADERVSVIIPAYRAAATLGKALESVLVQTVPAWEIIVVDDGSPEDLAAVVAPYGSRVTLLHKKNGGAASARNYGIQHATGDVIAFLDADDDWEPSKLEKQLAVLKKHPAVGLVAGQYYERSAGGRVRRALPEGTPLERVLPFKDERVFYFGTLVWTGTVMVRKSVLGESRFDESLSTAEDRDMWIRILSSTACYFIAEPLATYTISEGSLSNHNRAADRRNMLTVIRRHGHLLGATGVARWTSRVYANAAVTESRALWSILHLARSYLWWPFLYRRDFPHGSVPRVRTLAGRLLRLAGLGLREPERDETLHGEIARNAAWNWAGVAVSMLVGFFIMPFLVRTLGDTGYGLWILVGSLTGYFGLLDLGVRGSVGWNVAHYTALGDYATAKRILSTAFAILCGMCGLSVASSAGATLFVTRFFDIPSEMIADTRLALVLCGANLGLSMVASVFDANLWAKRRFSLLNRIDIWTTLLRAGSTVALVKENGLVALACITFACTLLGGGLKAIATCHDYGSNPLRWSLVDRQAAKLLYRYGVWYFIVSTVRLLGNQVGALVVGAQLSISAVTPYSIATRLVGYSVSLISSASDVLAPVATALNAKQQHEKLAAFFLRGGMYCLTFVFLVDGLLVALGRPLIRLWMGPEYEWPCYAVLLAVVLCEALPMSQWVTYNLVIGMGRQRFWAGITALELALGAGGAYLAAKPFGLLGVALAVGIPGVLLRGLAQLFFAKYLLQFRWSDVARQTVFPSLCAAAPAMSALALAVYWHRPENWPSMIVYSLGYVGLFGICCLSQKNFADLREIAFGAVRALGRYRSWAACEPKDAAAATGAES